MNKTDTRKYQIRISDAYWGSHSYHTNSCIFLYTENGWTCLRNTEIISKRGEMALSSHSITKDDDYIIHLLVKHWINTFLNLLQLHKKNHTEWTDEIRIDKTKHTEVGLSRTSTPEVSWKEKFNCKFSWRTNHLTTLILKTSFVYQAKLAHFIYRDVIH